MRFSSIHKGFSLHASNRYKPAQSATGHKSGHSDRATVSCDKYLRPNVAYGYNFRRRNNAVCKKGKTVTGANGENSRDLLFRLFSAM